MNVGISHPYYNAISLAETYSGVRYFNGFYPLLLIRQ
ncbi:hypothetical protein H845_1048 [Komagataeibacter xylinus E25]|nr:hypothetical protein H845_1048 [Komagataeibacter xylinus E25]